MKAKTEHVNRDAGELRKTNIIKRCSRRMFVGGTMLSG